ncbi:alpha/beta fold hydrolase [Enterococcus sp. 669A]|uniref:Alpha/beta fold hydrolase n=1 Tax=Candidatus Enterococcus moelleringii TaxID=2815325 RepID=A0ABS3LGR2_9ENTE|nr:alpha/beta hydrolase [Enterococcus sp. 669A]MBO1308822.1 alpha/beta fold hydrolase [Enterococcus sp. 669A]
MKKSIKKKLIIGVSILMGSIVIAGLGASYYFGKLVVEGLFYQNDGNDTKNNSLVQLEEWGYDLEAFNAKYSGKDFNLEAEDGNTVPVTFFSTDDNENKDTAILIHGAGGDHVFVSPLAEMYLENGWNVLSFDTRGHGDNESPLVTFGYLERFDVSAIVDYAEEITNNKKIVVHGQSMGGATAGMYAATEHAAEHTDAIIMDSPVYSMEEMFVGVWQEMEDTEDIPLPYIIACGNLYMKLNHGFTFKDVEITEQQKYNEVKTLVINSAQDDICSPEKVVALYDNVASADKELVTINTEHIKGIFDQKEEYETAVMQFLSN